jgi:hypothetical protein
MTINLPENMWKHNCVEEGILYVGNNKCCNWCGQSQYDERVASLKTTPHKLIAIAGSQSCGKSRLISSLQEQSNYNLQFVTRKTSRSILSDWNVTLEQVNSDYQLTQKFQEEILSRKLSDDCPSDTTTTLVTERTPIDLLVYAIMSLGNKLSYNQWLDQYCQKCIDSCSMYDKVFYIVGGKFAIEHDNVRCTSTFYQRSVDNIMFSFYNDIFKDRLVIIDCVNLLTRKTIVESNLQHQTIMSYTHSFKEKK